MRIAIIAVSAAIVLSACTTPSPEVRNAGWERDAYLLTNPATNY